MPLSISDLKLIINNNLIRMKPDTYLIFNSNHSKCTCEYVIYVCSVVDLRIKYVSFHKP